MSQPLVVSPALTIPADELRWTSVRSSGPGGQNVNKVSSKVELRFDFERSRVLGDDTEGAFARAGRVTPRRRRTDPIVSQATRDRQRNLEDARAKLAELVLRAFDPSQAPPSHPPVLRRNPNPLAREAPSFRSASVIERRPESE